MNKSAWRLRLLICIWPAMLSATSAWAVDDFKVLQLEEDVRNLQREVNAQNRRIETLETALRQALAKMTAPGARESIRILDSTPAWLEQASWDKLRIGMSEAEAIRVLGTPNSTRATEGDKTRTLFYAMELEAGGFLSGQVVVSDQKVVDIRKPMLK